MKARGWTVGLLISLAALLVAFWGVQPARFGQVLRDAQYVYLIPAGGLMLVGLLARARSWHILLEESVSFGRSFSAMNEGYLLNSVLPFRLGEVARAYVVSRGESIRGGAALATVVIERLLDVAITLAGLLVALPYAAGATWAGEVAVSAGLALIVVTLIVVGFVYRRGDLRTITSRLPFVSRLGIEERLDHFGQGLEVIRRPIALLRAGFWSLIAWATTWVQFLLFLRMFGLEGSLPMALFISGVIAFGAALPSSPGAVGVYELATVAALLVFGVAKELAASVAVMAHGFQLAFIGVLGSWALIRDGETVLGLAAQARSFLQRAQSSPSA